MRLYKTKIGTNDYVINTNLAVKQKSGFRDRWVRKRGERDKKREREIDLSMWFPKTIF